MAKEYPTGKVERVRDVLTIRTLLLQLDVGEAEAIALALSEEDSLVILDDKKARGVALDLGLSITGTIGVLIKAKRQGILSDLSEVIEELESVHFRLSPALKEEALRMAKEGE